ncbi:protein rolling stone-like isoform X1 [Polistes fuscatus]|uniref:protein rolling stone-like isoform X1 n=1 Tax=Polistes fuscatus TaxID=30207 RepID=UPI001CA8B4CD|nr:protein rolling stone-like isoform X1 [Polistes fuscatus]
MSPKCNNKLNDRDLPERTSCIGDRIKDPLNLAVTTIGRQAMLNKFWNYEVLRKYFNTKTEPPHVQLFSQPKCQIHVANWYLLYRWLIFVAWISIIFCSLFEFGSYKPQYKWEKWPIYLTNWDLALGLIQSFLGALIVSKRWKLQKDPAYNISDMKLTMLEKSYWVFYTVTSSLAVGVTVTYWTAVYNPKINYIDPLNIMLHVCNSILMLIDLSITSVPIYMKNVWWCLIVVLFYIIFSIIYYAAGGLDKNGYHYIYKILNWEKPIQTLLICAGCMTFIVLLHFLLCLFDKLRDCLYFRITKKIYNVPSIKTDYNVTKKEAEIV